MVATSAGIFDSSPIALTPSPSPIAGSLAMLVAQLLFTYLPVMNKLFHTTPIDALSWLRIVGIAALAFVAVELEKWIRFGRAPSTPGTPRTG